MNKSKKRNRIMFLTVLLLAITIGFAALATTLKINGSAIVDKGSWNIYWDNAQVTPGSKSVENAPSIEEDQGDPQHTKVVWGVMFDVPGEFYEFTVDAVNAGSMDAVITDITSTITKGGVATTLPDYIKYEITYDDDTSIAVNDLLPKKDTSTTPATNGKKTYKIRVEFTDDIEPEEMNTIPAGGVRYDFEYDVEYGQASMYDMSKKTLVALKSGNVSLAGKTDEELVQYYGTKVTGFNTIYPVSWDLFYSDEDYVFLIVDDFVESKYLPNELYKQAGRDYACGFTDYGTRGLILDDPRWSNGIQSDAIQNNPLTKKYFTWAAKYPNSTLDSTRAVAYMMDTSIWDNFAGNASGAFAIGGPTLEMFVASYNAANPLKLQTFDNMVEGTNVSQYGYIHKWVDFYGNEFSYNTTVTSPHLFNTNAVPNMWDASGGSNTDVWLYYLASPGHDYNASNMIGVGNQGSIYNYYRVDNPYYNFRPVVAIPKSSIR